MPKTQQEIQATKSQWERPLNEVAWALTSLATISSSQVSNRLVTLSEAIGGDDLKKRSQAFAQLNEIFTNEPDLAEDIANYTLPLGDFYAHMVVLNDCLDAGLDLETFAKILPDHKQAYDRKMGKQDAEPIAPEVPVTKKTNAQLKASRSKWIPVLEEMQTILGNTADENGEQKLYDLSMKDLDDIHSCRMFAEELGSVLKNSKDVRDAAIEYYGDVKYGLFEALHVLDENFKGFDLDDLEKKMPEHKNAYDAYMTQKQAEEPQKQAKEAPPQKKTNDALEAARSEWKEDLDLMRILMGRAFGTAHDREMFAAHHRDLDDIDEARLLAEKIGRA